jgi:hypothetical protein
VVKGGPIELGAWIHPALDGDPALTIVASRHTGVYRSHPLEAAPVTGEFRINPLCGRGRRRRAAPPPAVSERRLRRRYGAAKQYLPRKPAARRDELAAFTGGQVPASLVDLQTQGHRRTAEGVLLTHVVRGAAPPHLRTIT